MNESKSINLFQKVFFIRSTRHVVDKCANMRQHLFQYSFDNFSCFIFLLFFGQIFDFFFFRLADIYLHAVYSDA